MARAGFILLRADPAGSRWPAAGCFTPDTYGDTHA
jgi:hypothetical protein